MYNKIVNWKASILSLLYLLCCACTANGRVAGKVGYNNNYYSGKSCIKQLEWVYALWRLQADFRLVCILFIWHVFKFHLRHVENKLSKLSDRMIQQKMLGTTSHIQMGDFSINLSALLYHRSKDFFLLQKNTPLGFISLLLHAAPKMHYLDRWSTFYS